MLKIIFKIYIYIYIYYFNIFLNKKYFKKQLFFFFEYPKRQNCLVGRDLELEDLMRVC